MRRAPKPRRPRLTGYTITVRSLRSRPFGRETFASREDAEHFVEEVRSRDPEVAALLHVEERELEAGGLN
jgi:hypothetical protein